MTLPLRPFYMIRHGQTEANAARLAAGAVDTPLTPRGIAQAQEAALAARFLDPMPSHIYHSHLSRTRDTARILNESLGLAMDEDPNLAEQDFGDWAEKPYELVPNALRAQQDPPHGEKTKDFDARAIQAIAAILHGPHAHPLIVSHGGIFDALFRHYGRDPYDFENAVLYAFLPAQTLSFPWEIWRCAREGGRKRFEIEIEGADAKRGITIPFKGLGANI